MTHTWDLTVRYHCCPKCGYILEIRRDATRHEKDLTCSRCDHHFTLAREESSNFLPLFGGGDHSEVRW